MKFSTMLIYGLCMTGAFLIQARIFRGVLQSLKTAGVSEPPGKTVFAYLNADTNLHPRKHSKTIFLGLMTLEVLSLVIFAVIMVRSTLIIR